MIKVIFTELNQEYGHQMTVGEKQFNTDDIQEVEIQAQTYSNVLSEVRGNKVTFMLEKNGGILASFN